MGRRWWIASGVLIGVLALISFVLTRATGPTVTETAQVFTGVDHGPAAWAPGPAAVLGGLLVVAGLLVAVASLAYALGRRHAGAATAEAAEPPTETEAGPELPADAAPEPGRTTARRSWALPAALSLSLALLAGGLVLVVTDPSSGYTLTNGVKGIAPVDNVAAVPFGPPGTTYGLVTVGGVVPDVTGLPYDIAVVALEQAGFTALDVRDRDGGGVPDGVTPDRIVDRVLPEPGATPPSGTQIVLYLR